MVLVHPEEMGTTQPKLDYFSYFSLFLILWLTHSKLSRGTDNRFLLSFTIHKTRNDCLWWRVIVLGVLGIATMLSIRNPSQNKLVDWPTELSIVVARLAATHWGVRQATGFPHTCGLKTYSWKCQGLNLEPSAYKGNVLQWWVKTNISDFPYFRGDRKYLFPAEFWSDTHLEELGEPTKGMEEGRKGAYLVVLWGGRVPASKGPL